MVFLSLKKWSGQFSNRGVINRIRRAIEGRLACGDCVVVIDDGAIGLTAEVRSEIQRDWAATKVRFSEVHPILGGPTAKCSRRKRWRMP
jgi:hypothetical protein